MLYLWRVRKLKNLIFVVHFFSQIGLKIKIICLEIEACLNVSEKRKGNRKISFRIRQKSGLFSAHAEEIRAFQL